MVQYSKDAKGYVVRILPSQDGMQTVTSESTVLLVYDRYSLT